MLTNYAIKIWSILIGDKMKDSFKIALILLLASVNTLDAQALPAATTGSTTHQTKLKRLDFRLEKVSCARCILNVRQALRKADGPGHSRQDLRSRATTCRNSVKDILIHIEYFATIS